MPNERSCSESLVNGVLAMAGFFGLNYVDNCPNCHFVLLAWSQLAETVSL